VCLLLLVSLLMLVLMLMCLLLLVSLVMLVLMLMLVSVAACTRSLHVASIPPVIDFPYCFWRPAVGYLLRTFVGLSTVSLLLLLDHFLLLLASLQVARINLFLRSVVLINGSEDPADPYFCGGVPSVPTMFPASTVT
jgi:hypothetical protein